MARAEFDACEREAFDAAGDAAGAFADAIGKTDLATMTAPEWAQFRRIMLDTFGTSLAKILSTRETIR